MSTQGACWEVVQRMVDTAIKEFGTVDIIVNNAGITRDVILRKMTDEQWDQVIAVNLTGVFYGIQCAARVMREKGYGKIINISSTSALGNAGQINYAATKAGVIGMTKTAAKELGAKGVNVNAIAPGIIKTRLSEALWKDPAVNEKAIAQIPMMRLGEPEEIAGAIVFLASKAGSYITGETLVIDGGRVHGEPSHLKKV